MTTHKEHIRPELTLVLGLYARLSCVSILHERNPPPQKNTLRVLEEAFLDENHLNHFITLIYSPRYSGVRRTTNGVDVWYLMIMIS